MSLALTPPSYTSEELAIPNNNPGTAPDYTEHDVISLRRYNGDPLNHTQADDNLELLRRRLGQIVSNVLTNTKNISEVGDYFHSEDFHQHIGDIVNNLTFSDEFINNLVNRLIQNVDLNNHFVTHNWFGENIQVVIDESIDNYFNLVTNEFWENVEQYVIDIFNPTTINNTLVDSLTTMFGDQFVSLNDYTVLSETVGGIHQYISEQVTQATTPIQQQVSQFDGKMDVIEELLEDLDVDGTLDLSAIIAKLNALGADTVINANNILALNNSLNQAIASITANAANIKILDANFAALELSHRNLIDHVNKSIKALDDLIKGLFDDLKNLLTAIIIQIMQNQADIGTLFNLLNFLAAQFFNAIMALWDEIGNIWTELEDHEDRICKLEAQSESILDYIKNLSWRTIDICDDGVNIEIKVMEWESGKMPDNPNNFEADFENAMNAAIGICDPIKFKDFKDKADAQAKEEREQKEKKVAALNAAIAAAKAARQAGMNGKLNNWAANRPANPQAFPIHMPGPPLIF